MLKKKLMSLLLVGLITTSGCFVNASAEQLSGDVNGDGSVDTADALIVLRASLGIDKLTADIIKKSDMNNDGQIDSSDALEVLKIAIVSNGIDFYKDFNVGQTYRGIDVSFWQEDVDFQKVKASGIDFVIIRAGGATDDPSENHDDVDPRRQGVDKCFEKNYADAKAAGLKVGVYWFSFARTNEQAKREAESCLKAIKDKQLDYPVYYDVEYPYQIEKGKSFCSQIIDTFCSTIKNGGYYPGYYMSASYIPELLDNSVRNKYDCWVAQHNTDSVTYDVDYFIWQKGITAIDGVNGDVDYNVSYINYPVYIKSQGLNGWK